jgi:hypothetical protein
MLIGAKAPAQLGAVGSSDKRGSKAEVTVEKSLQKWNPHFKA